MPKAKAKKFYAVAKGAPPCPAIYETWPECEQKVNRFPGASYKGFETRAQAEAWLGSNYIYKPGPSSKDMKPYDRPAKVSQNPEPLTPTMPPPAPQIQLSPEQDAVLKRVVSGGNIFFSGSAGTGKSVLLREIIQALKTRRKVAVTASTGIAAVAISGCTLHSWAGIGIGQEPATKVTGKWFGNYDYYQKVISRWKTVDTLIIDEISMIDGKLFDKLEEIARIVRKNDDPFGGIQLVLSGDYFQLPPVPDRNPHNNQQMPIVFTFDAEQWDICMGPPVNLTRVFRQKDQRFVDLLNAMRFGRVEPEDVEVFRRLQRQVQYDDGIEPTELLSRRDEVDTANNRRLEQLPGEIRTYVAQQYAGHNSQGYQITEQQMEKLLDKLVAPKQISLKVGAQVMLVKNLIQGQLVNGSVGQVIRFCTVGAAAQEHIDIAKSDNEKDNKKPDVPQGLEAQSWPVVRFTNGAELLMTPEDFTIDNADGKMEAQRTQIPLILAWSLSVHKSQGQTIERVRVDLRSTFEKGQAYVAISRATTMEGLQVLNFNVSKVMVHPRVVAWYSECEDLALRQRGDDDWETGMDYD